LVEAAQDAHAIRLGNTPQQLEHPSTRIGVEARHRLVGDDKIGLLGERASDRDALLLATRKTV
jgi:hypothetical protein